MSSIEMSRLGAFTVPDYHAASHRPAGADGRGRCETPDTYRREIRRFEAGMMHAVDRRTLDLPSGSAALVRAGAQRHVRDAARAVLGAPLPTGKCLTTDDMMARILRAGDLAGAALDKAVAQATARLMSIATDRARAPVAPQIVPRAESGFNLMRRVPPIENLVLSGGGAKGVGMGGALQAMADAGMLDDLRVIAGSSAGALVATWLGVGRGMDEMNAVIAGELRQLLATDDSLNAVYPDIEFRSTARITAALLSPFGATHDTATGMIRKLDEVTAQEVGVFLRAADPAALRRDVTLAVLQLRAEAEEAGRRTAPWQVETALARLATLAEAPDFCASRAGRMVTFADMALLHALAPGRFRHVSITAHDTRTGTNVLFDRHTTPTLPVAYAARASMAHPLIATGVSFPQLAGLPARHLLADGGISSNMPVEALTGGGRPRANSDPAGLHPPAMQRLQAASALMAFDNNGEADALMHAPGRGQPGSLLGRVRDSIANRLAGWVASNPHMAADSAADRRKIHDFGPNVVNVKHGDLSTMDLDASLARKHAAIEDARSHARERLAIARGDLYAVEVASVEAAFALLDEEEKSLLRDADVFPGADDARDQAGAAQRRLVQMAREAHGRHGAGEPASLDSGLDAIVERVFLRA